jgi:aminopeptidase-like protein
MPAEASDDLTEGIDPEALGTEMHDFMADLYPICRSITGQGVRDTLGRIDQRLPLAVHEVPSGTGVFDWTVPREWNIAGAWVRDPGGRRVIDFRDSNLHVMSYSTPVQERLPLAALKEHLHSLPEHPAWIPYRTSYYREAWGFCLSDADLQALEEGDYDVEIDSSFTEGSLTYGECHLPGDTEDEVLISCHICHPSLANDNLSGIALATVLGQHLLARPHRYSYRLVFIPGTIGAITWLALNEGRVAHVRHGLVVTGVGGPGGPTYKRSRRGDTEIDRAAVHVLRTCGQDYRVMDFVPYGYDERQYCSPGFNLAVGSLMRTPNGEYPEYHTSADNLDFVRPEQLADSLVLYLRVLDTLEHNHRYLNLNPRCEPQLGKRGLYPSVGARGAATEQMAMLWVLNLSDGVHDLLAIAERSGLPFGAIRRAASRLEGAGLLARASEAGREA